VTTLLKSEILLVFFFVKRDPVGLFFIFDQISDVMRQYLVQLTYLQFSGTVKARKKRVHEDFFFD
jgi:hypothetical protein